MKKMKTFKRGNWTYCQLKSSALANCKGGNDGLQEIAIQEDSSTSVQMRTTGTETLRREIQELR